MPSTFLLPRGPAALLGKAGLLLILAWLLPSPAGAAEKPNVVVILVDDMGFSDIGCYGGEIPTPNIDKLAAHGLRFTQFYNTGRCCPTRASLLTGLYAHQAGVGAMMEDRGVPGYRGGLTEDCATIAEVMRGAGYFTAMSGKWHVGQEKGVVPWQRGFERSLNAPAGGFYYGTSPRAELWLNGRQLPMDDPALPPNWYATDLWTDFGLRFIDEAHEARKPFFLYLAYNAPHFPLQAPLEEIAKFRGRYRAGWDKLRVQRYARQLELGLLEPGWELSPRPEAVKAWDNLTEQRKEHFDHLMAIYAAVVAHLDTQIGVLVEGLEKRGALENTLILFMSDNGGNAESGPGGKLIGEVPGSADSDVFCGQSWATLENTPFRRYKHFNHEGGIATPLIAHWPAGISEKGAWRSQPGHVIDILPTCAEVGGATFPTQREGHAIPPLEGRSLVPAFADQPIARDGLFWEHEGNAAVRVGDLKLVRAGRAAPWELYDLKKDRTELHNLVGEKPKEAEELAQKWEAWAVRAQVNPYNKKGTKGGAATPDDGSTKAGDAQAD